MEHLSSEFKKEDSRYPNLSVELDAYLEGEINTSQSGVNVLEVT